MTEKLGYYVAHINLMDPETGEWRAASSHHYDEDSANLWLDDIIQMAEECGYYYEAWVDFDYRLRAMREGA